MLGSATKERRLSYSDPAFSLSETDRQYLPQFRQRRGSIQLKSQFSKELIAESLVSKHYLSSAQREQYRIQCQDGFYKDAKGDLLDGPYVYVLFPDDRLYAASVFAKINHSHLSSGLSLKGAGIHYYQRGRLITVSNESGHYKPTLNEMRDALLWFSSQNTTGSFIFEDHSQQNVDDEFNGIKYFEVIRAQGGEIALDLIQNGNLVATLSRVKRAALSVYDEAEDDEFERRLAQLCTRAEEAGDDSVYYSETPTSPRYRVEHSPFSRHDIFSHRDLLMLTCLQFAANRGKFFSRFNGVLKFSI